MANPDNLVLKLAKEHIQMRRMIESLFGGLITPAAFMAKHKNHFYCDVEVEMYADDIVRAFERGEEQLTT